MANYTTNYNLKKPLGTENYNVEDQNGNMDIIDIKLKEIDDKASNISVPVTSVNSKTGAVVLSASDIKTSSGNTLETSLSDLATEVNDKTTILTASGTANAITLDILLQDKNKYSFKATADSTGAVSINGIALKKIDGTAISNLKANKIYDFYYDETQNSVFILAKAEGNATVADVLAGKVFSNGDDTGLVGTMDLTNLKAENIKKGVTINGVTGDKLEYGSGNNIPVEKINAYGQTVKPSMYWKSSSSLDPNWSSIDSLPNDGIYACSGYPNIIKFDINTGNQIKYVTADSNGVFCILTDKIRNKVYALTANYLKCYDESLSEIWSITASTIIVNGFTRQLQNMSQDIDYLYVGGADSAVAKINKDNGGTIWINSKLPTGAYTTSCNGDFLYVISFDSQLTVRLNKDTGEILSQFSCAYKTRNSCVDDEGYIYISTDNSTLLPIYKYSATGNVLATSFDKFQYVGHLYYNNNYIYITYYQNGLNKYDKTLNFLWNYRNEVYTGHNYKGICEAIIDNVQYMCVATYYVDLIRPFITLK